jgi:hypothetical protein
MCWWALDWINGLKVKISLNYNKWWTCHLLSWYPNWCLLVLMAMARLHIQPSTFSHQSPTRGHEDRWRNLIWNMEYLWWAHTPIVLSCVGIEIELLFDSPDWLMTYVLALKIQKYIQTEVRGERRNINVFWIVGKWDTYKHKPWCYFS